MVIILLICKFFVFILPISMLYGIGRFIGFVSYYLAIRRRNIVLTNLALCFPDLSIKKRKALARKSFVNLGLGLLETLICWTKPIKLLKKQKMELIGKENLDQVKKLNKGCIIISGHMTSLEFIQVLLSKYGEFDFVYRPHENSYINKAMISGRRKFNHEMISRNNMRQMLRNLKNKRRVVYLIDQDLGLPHSHFIPFFNIPAITVTTMYRIAKQTDSVIIPAMFYRDKSGKYYTKFYPIINMDNFKNLNDEQKGIEVAKIYNKLLEENIKKHPDQYFWAHRRFKTRPDGEEDFYKDI